MQQRKQQQTHTWQIFKPAARCLQISSKACFFSPVWVSMCTGRSLNHFLHSVHCERRSARFSANQYTGSYTETFSGIFFWDYPGEPIPQKWTNLDFTEARDSEWQWHQLGHMQVCTSLQKHNHASTPPLCFLQAGCPFCCPLSFTST